MTRSITPIWSLLQFLRVGEPRIQEYLSILVYITQFIQIFNISHLEQKKKYLI